MSAARSEALELRRALARHELTAAAAYRLADGAAESRSINSRELAAALFWVAAQLQAHTDSVPQPSEAPAPFERLCVLATDGESWRVRRRALSLLAALPAVPRELVDRAINKRAAGIGESYRKRSAAAALEEEQAKAFDIDDLVVGWRSDERRQKDAAAAAARLRAGAGFPDPPPDARALLTEAVAGSVQLSLEDEWSDVRYAGVGAVCDLVWPHGPLEPPLTNPGRAVGLLLGSCNDESPSVRERALRCLVQLAGRLRLRAAELSPVALNVADGMHHDCANAALELLANVGLRDAPALDVVRNALASSIKARQNDPERVRAVRDAAAAIGCRHAALALGSALTGLSRQAASCGSGDVAGGSSVAEAASAEQVVAFELLGGARRALPEGASVEETADGDGRGAQRVASASVGRASALETADEIVQTPSEAKEGKVLEVKTGARASPAQHAPSNREAKRAAAREAMAAAKAAARGTTPAATAAGDGAAAEVAPSNREAKRAASRAAMAAAKAAARGTTPAATAAGAGAASEVAAEMAAETAGAEGEGEGASVLEVAVENWQSTDGNGGGGEAVSRRIKTMQAEVALLAFGRRGHGVFPSGIVPSGTVPCLNACIAET